MAEPPTSESMNPQARSWIVEYTVVSVGGAVLGPSGRAPGQWCLHCALPRQARGDFAGDKREKKRPRAPYLTLIRKPCCAASVHGSGILV
jgi:hypothetical protein